MQLKPRKTRTQVTLCAGSYATAGVTLLDEPTAAFYFYFDQQRAALEVGDRQNVLVFDFGGGTLDVSIIDVNRNGEGILIDAIGRSRYNNLGGDDIDLDIATFLLGCWEFRTSQELDPLDADLRREIFQLFVQKSQLFKEEVEDHLAGDLDMPEFFMAEEVRTDAEVCKIDLRAQLSRSQYDEITYRFLQDKQEINIFRPIGQALEVAGKIRPGFSVNDIDLILYTGGASRMAAVKAALECYFAPKRCFSLSDVEACNTVALGAACCRFDELHSAGSVRMTARMLESVLTRSDDGFTYVPLVPIDCEPSDSFRRVEHQFRTGRDIIRLRLPLFRGTGPTDPQLNPMRDCEIKLQRLIERDTPYFIHSRTTHDKTIQLKVRFSTALGDVEETAYFDIDTQSNSRSASPGLAQVNII